MKQPEIDKTKVTNKTPEQTRQHDLVMNLQADLHRPCLAHRLQSLCRLLQPKWKCISSFTRHVVTDMFDNMEVIKRRRNNCKKQSWRGNYYFQHGSHTKRAWSNIIYYVFKHYIQQCINSRRKLPSYRNQLINLLCKSVDWSLYASNLRV